MIKTRLENPNNLRNAYLQKDRQVKNMQTEKETMKNSTDRITQIKEQIQSGQYKIDLKQTSEKLALNLLGL